MSINILLPRYNKHEISGSFQAKTCHTRTEIRPNSVRILPEFYPNLVGKQKINCIEVGIRTQNLFYQLISML